jgi:hypothetical protein
MSPKIVSSSPAQSVSDREDRSPEQIEAAYTGSFFVQSWEFLVAIALALIAGILIGSATVMFVHRTGAALH